MGDGQNDSSKYFPFLMLVPNGVIAWANGWSSALVGTGLAHPEFDVAGRKMASLVGVVVSIAIIALLRSTSHAAQVKCAKFFLWIFALSFIATLVFALTIDFFTSQHTVILVRKAWELSWLFTIISLLSTLAALSLLIFNPIQRDE